jgi:hypothetical protein
MGLLTNMDEKIKVAELKRGRGRPKLANPKSAAERKREQTARILNEFETLDPDQWPERVCLFILSHGRYTDSMKQIAFRRYGVIHGWVGNLELAKMMENWIKQNR